MPEKKVDEETLRAFEKDFINMKDGRLNTLSVDEFIELLSKELDD